MIDVYIPTRGFKQNLRFLVRILRGESLTRPFTTVAEKLVYSILILGRFFSLSNCGVWFFRSERAWSNFLDVYLMTWPVALLWLLFKWPLPTAVVVTLAIYQVAMVLSNQLAVLLVDTQSPGWRQPSIGRGFILSLVNLTSIVVSYAVIYRACNCIVPAGGSVPEQGPLQLLYYSTVTVTTLGYGDFVPDGRLGYLVAIAELVTVVLFVLAVIPAYLGALSPRIAREYGRQGDRSRERSRTHFHRELRSVPNVSGGDLRHPSGVDSRLPNTKPVGSAAERVVAARSCGAQRELAGTPFWSNKSGYTILGYRVISNAYQTKQS